MLSHFFHFLFSSFQGGRGRTPRRFAPAPFLWEDVRCPFRLPPSSRCGGCHSLVCRRVGRLPGDGRPGDLFPHLLEYGAVIGWDGWLRDPFLSCVRGDIPPDTAASPNAKERGRPPPFGKFRPLSFPFRPLRLKRPGYRRLPSPVACARGMHPAGPPPPTGRGCRGPAPPAAGVPR